MLRRPAAALLATALIALSASAGVAAASPQHAPATIGGPLLASDGVIVDAGPEAPSLPAPSDLPAASWLVANLTTGQILAAKAPHERFLPASTLKMLTAATLIPRLNPDAMFRVSYHDEVVDGTKAGLTVGMHYKISTLFQCMLEMSANDAAEALAEAYGGVKETLRAMNDEARVLQANDTHADTPSGLDGPGETTSAYDLALMAQADFGIPAFRHYITQLSTNIPAAHHKHFQIQSHNNLLYYYKGDVGGKNGYTVAADATYVGAATRHGQTIVVSLMHAYPRWWPTAAKLLDWGFKANGKVTPVGQLVQPIPPAPLPVTHAAADVAPTAAIGTTHRTNNAPLIETLAVMVTAFGAGMTAVRRIIPRRRKSSLSLPPI
ncbi:MAG TPA: D-alanyl-D-alanine carboxypeptidase [Mycobacteriales bacterium]|jgi:D-alanyl-D-alanine carboxypeptidase (penicillin-binding protein 5/6)|nr:D-alanyl-D-alanine carboxypeptidase [Mycobacteriales bacterium]